MAVTQRKARRDLRDCGGLADPGGSDQCYHPAPLQDLGLAQADLVGEQIKRLAPGLLRFFGTADPLRQAARQLGIQPERHQSAEQRLRVRRALPQVVPAQAAQFGLHPATQVLHLAPHVGKGVFGQCCRLVGGSLGRLCGKRLPRGDALIDDVGAAVFDQIHRGRQLDTTIDCFVGEYDGVFAERLADHAQGLSHILRNKTLNLHVQRSSLVAGPHHGP